MYNFRDITQVVEASESVLPSEALMINGEYIENLIPGYRTLNVAGRESLSPEIETFTTGVRDGSTRLSRRYPERIITITYQLMAKTNEAFREAFNTLGKVLNVEDAELIFNDEQDKYFIGTPYTIEEVEPGRNAVVGKFEILCADPFKYSVVEYEAEANLDDGSILVDYNGSYKSYPILQAEFCEEEEANEDGTKKALEGIGDCGYVGFFNESQKIIQLGNPDEIDGIENYHEKSQALIAQIFSTNYGWDSQNQEGWIANNGELVTSQQIGTVGLIRNSTMVTKLYDTKKTTTILSEAKSTASAPTFYYTVTAKATDRTENKVKITFAVTAALGRSTSYFGRGYILKGSLCVAGTWHDFTFKKSNERWEGTSGHTVNISVWVDGLTTASASVSAKFKAFRGDTLGTAGTLASTNCKPVVIPIISKITGDKNILARVDTQTVTGAHAAVISKTLPADATGDVGAANFKLKYMHEMCIGDSANASNQRGAFKVQITDSEGLLVAGITVQKNKKGNKADLIFTAKNLIKTYPNAVDVSYSSNYAKANNSHVKTCTIEKFGNTAVFTCAGKSFTLGDDFLVEQIATKITLSFESYSSYEPVKYNGLSYLSFHKHNCDTFKDLPNKFTSNDILEVDCSNGDILLNGISKPQLGALGNDWEQFYLVPGLNQIGVAYSDWVKPENAPTFKVRYREVYL